MHDRAGAHVSSALGVLLPQLKSIQPWTFKHWLRATTIAHGALDYLVCDEAQFYTDAQVEQLAQVVDELDVDV